MKSFQTKHYEIQSDKLKQNTEIKMVVLADLHSMEFGEENAELLQAIEQEQPDVVLVAGDMMVRSDLETFGTATKFLKKLAQKFRIYYALGNHEYKIMTDEEHREHYEIYEKQLLAENICFLHNQKIMTRIKGNPVMIYGLEIPMEYYKKPFSPYLRVEGLKELLGDCSKDELSILLAHNPKYGKTYLEWGADLTLSGHYHGGVLRFNENHGLVSPQYLVFPPYCCGEFEKNGKHMIVSAGLGEHTIPVRIHNPRELIVVTMKAPENVEHTDIQ